MIERALERFGGNRRKAAEALKISTVTLWRPWRERHREGVHRTDDPLIGHERPGGARALQAVSADTMTAPMNCSWPGNVRELEHAIKRVVIVARGDTIRPREWPPEISQKPRQRASDDSLDLREHERPMIERALERFRGSRKEAAQALKISTVTLWRKMNQHALAT